MATFVWIGSGTDSLGDQANWLPNGIPAAGDTAILVNANGGYTVTVLAQTHAVDTIRFATNGTANQASFTIGNGNAPASLTTTNLQFSQKGNAQTDVTINGGATFDVTTAITNNTSHIETISISSGTGGPGAGGHLVFGNLLVGAAGSTGTGAVNYEFGTEGTETASGGLIEFSSGFVSGSTTTTQTITGVAWGDEFQFDGANFTGDTVTFDTTTHVLTVKNASNATVLTMNNVTSDTPNFIAFGNIIEAVCYARGTMIRTPDGELPVEKLRRGKRVITLVDGEEVTQTVTWLGHRRIDLTSHPRPETVAPIRIERDAFADNVPHRDLLVSPDHAVFVDGMLICARQLMNGTTIRREKGWTAVDYYHVELNEHAILLAEGLPAESYIDTGNSGFFANSDRPMVLHPDLTAETGYPTREANSCVPFVSDEFSVRPVWERLAERAAAIGRPMTRRKTTTDADLRMMAKGRAVRPIYSDDKLVIFTLPRGADEVRLISRAQLPTEARPWLSDPRRLGVPVARLVLRGADEVREIPVDHPDLVDGWWAVEHDGQAMGRWTDGEAILPLPPMRGIAMLEIHLVGAMTYAVDAMIEDVTKRRVA